MPLGTNVSSEKPLRCDGTTSAKSIFAERLKAEIAKKGWSLRRTAEEVALHLDQGAKFGPAHVWHYLQARTLPRPRYLVALSRALGVSPDELMPVAPRRRGQHRAEAGTLSSGGPRFERARAGKPSAARRFGSGRSATEPA